MAHVIFWSGVGALVLFLPGVAATINGDPRLLHGAIALAVVSLSLLLVDLGRWRK